MTEHISTYTLVLAATYPELRDVLEKLMGGRPLNTENLELYKKSIVHSTVVSNLKSITYTYASNYNRVNLSLKKIEQLIDHISIIKYEYLTEYQKERLPSLAKEIDAASQHIREEVFPSLIEGKQTLSHDLEQQLGVAITYLQSINEALDSGISHINEQFNVSLQWTQGKKVFNYEQLRRWMEHCQNVDDEIKHKILQDSSKVTIFIKSVLAMELLTFYSKNKTIGSEKINEMVDFINQLAMEDIEVDEVKVKPGHYVQDMTETAEKVDALEKELLGYATSKDEVPGDPSADLENTIDKEIIYTTVDKEVKD